MNAREQEMKNNNVIVVRVHMEISIKGRGIWHLLVNKRFMAETCIMSGRLECIRYKTSHIDET